MQIDLTSIARRCYNVVKQRCFNAEISRQFDVENLTRNNVVKMLKMQIDLTSIVKSTSLNDVKIARHSDVDNFGSK